MLIYTYLFFQTLFPYRLLQNTEFPLLYRRSLLVIYFMYRSVYMLCFPGGASGKESTCNAGDPSSIAGLGRSAEEGIGYSLQYSWASLVAQQ